MPARSRHNSDIVVCVVRTYPDDDGGVALLADVPAVRELPLDLLTVRADDNALCETTIQDDVRGLREPGREILSTATVECPKPLIDDECSGLLPHPPM